MQWISVKDRLPEIPIKFYDDEFKMWVTPLSVQVIGTDGEDSFECTYSEDGKFSGVYFDNIQITHWMPLPEPPSTPNQ